MGRLEDVRLFSSGLFMGGFVLSSYFTVKFFFSKSNVIVFSMAKGGGL